MACSQTMARQDITGGLSESLCTSGKTGVSFVDNTANQCVAQDQLHTEPISNSKCQGAGDQELEAHGYDRVHSILQLGRGENMPTYLDNYKPNGFVVKMEIWLLSMQCGIVILPFALPLRLCPLSF